MAALHTETKRVAGNLHLRDTNISPANSLWETCPLQAIASDPTLAAVYYNDFWTFTTGEGGLANTISNSGTVGVIAASAAAPCGTLQMEASDGSVAAEDETYLGSESKVWVLQGNKDLWYESRVKFTEAATNEANIAVGLSSIYTANYLQDADAGPAANYDGIVLFKVGGGGTVWQAESSQAGNQTTLSSVQTRVSGSWVDVGFHVTSNSTIDYYINGVQVGSVAANLPTAAMGLVYGVKNGAASHEKLYVDFVKVVQLR